MSNSPVLFEELESRVLLSGTDPVLGGAAAQTNPVEVLQPVSVAGRSAKTAAKSRAVGTVSTTAGQVAYSCKTDYGPKPASTTGAPGAHALNWNAGGTWTGMDITGGVWSVDAKGKVQVDFSALDAQRIVDYCLGPTTTYSLRPRVSKAKIKAATATKAGAIAFRIQFRTHTTVWDPKAAENVEGHITGTYAAKYSIPATPPPPQDISQPMDGTLGGKVKVKDPTTGQPPLDKKKDAPATLDWNKDGTFAFGEHIKDGTWTRDAKGKIQVGISKSDVQRLVNALDTKGIAPVVLDHSVVKARGYMSLDGKKNGVAITIESNVLYPFLGQAQTTWVTIRMNQPKTK